MLHTQHPSVKLLEVVLQELPPREPIIVNYEFEKFGLKPQAVFKIHQPAPVLKPGPGRDPSVSKGYRPINLLSAFSKLCEKSIQSRLLCFTDENGVLIEEQFGFQFRNGRSTIHQLFRFYLNHPVKQVGVQVDNNGALGHSKSLRQCVARWSGLQVA